MPFLPCFFYLKNFLSGVLGLETSGEVWSDEDLASVEKDQVREHLNRFAIRKSMGHDGWYLRVLRELMSLQSHYQLILKD